MSEIESNTENGILKAARIVFTNKGFDGARMQEIADEAGINKALLHYYFRSKDKLFEAIFKDVLNTMFTKVISVLMAEMPLFEKIEKISSNYIDILTQNPDIAGFVFHEISRNPERLVGNMKSVGANFEIIKNQIGEEVKAGIIIPIKAEQLIANLMSLCVFPFIAKPVFMGITGMNQDDFLQFVEDRRQIIPHTIITAIKKDK
ncbi:MAG: TetR/AcrR family transcriptional regulator [Bacteroidetes bacterium HGW-Bacteroidetes-9]|jgi:AcrR family transcriptional regulator|nr:MAG: TetR/AcrR family transcriptional regulator [Bacteroidetes bacterium HGW-Bacteroidetes-9]